MDTQAPKTIGSSAFTLTVHSVQGELRATLTDRASGLELAAGPLRYRASRSHDDERTSYLALRAPSVDAGSDSIEIRGTLAGLELRQIFTLPAGGPFMEERISLRNAGSETVALEELSISLTRLMANHVGTTSPELRGDRLIAVPFRHRPTDPIELDVDLSFDDLARLSGREHRTPIEPLSWPQWGNLPAAEWASEGWAWVHGERALGVFKLNQEEMELSVLRKERLGEGLSLCFGGATLYAGDPSSLLAIAPGASVELGVTRYQSVEGGWREVAYAFRRFLDEAGCRFPEGYDPPVHWNELYDNPEWNLATHGDMPRTSSTRAIAYTRPLIELEAAKAREYGCESLYLDPGWDTDFGTFIWGESWLGPRRSFVSGIREKHGLGVSLHCPLATWMSADKRGVSSWPRESWQMREDGSIVEGAVCLGSRQYLDEAEKRLLAHCADGVVFLMFDGNWWNGGCWNPDHGHPVPYRREDHVRANLDLARRIHARYPAVLIEMHDMIAGGTYDRYTPVYYKYGLPGSYDENWGFELMWQPMEDIRSGRARSLYEYNLACNVPVYLHIDLRDDNEWCVVLWWYASTCRHLGIGGTHPTPAVAEAQKRAMRRYRELDRFYKRGEFYGIHLEVHVHALSAEGAFVVNLFNLSNESRIVEGSISMASMSMDPNRWYVMPLGCRIDRGSGNFIVSRRMPAWSAEVLAISSYPG